MDSADRSIEALLADLGHQVDWPDSSDLAGEVRRRVAAIPARRPRGRWVPVVAAVLILVASLLLLSPRARQAVADLLGVAGIEIEFSAGLPESVGSDLGLGPAVSFEEASDLVGFDVGVLEDLGDPAGIHYSDRPGGGRIDMVWVEGTLPAEAQVTDVSVLFSQFRPGLEGDGLIKGVGPESRVITVEVAGSPAFWIDGAPHAVSYVDASGRRVEEATRLAGNVLIWEADGTTYRIETTYGLEETIRLAESLSPETS